MRQPHVLITASVLIAGLIFCAAPAEAVGMHTKTKKTPTPTSTLTFTYTDSVSQEVSVSRSGSADRTKSLVTASLTSSMSRTVSTEISFTATGSGNTPSLSITRWSPSDSRSKTHWTRSSGVSMSVTGTPEKTKPSPSPSVTKTISDSITIATETDDRTLSSTDTPKGSQTSTLTMDQSFSPSSSKSGITPTRSKSHRTPTRSRTMSWEVTVSTSLSPDRTWSRTPSKGSQTFTFSSVRTATFSPSLTGTFPRSLTKTVSITQSSKPSLSVTPSKSTTLTKTVTLSRTVSWTGTSVRTLTPSRSPTGIKSNSGSASAEHSMTKSRTPSGSLTLTAAITNSTSRSGERTFSPTQSRERTSTSSPSRSRSPSVAHSLTFSRSRTFTVQLTRSFSGTLSDSLSKPRTKTHKRTKSDTATLSRTTSISGATNVRTSSSSPSNERSKTKSGTDTATLSTTFPHSMTRSETGRNSVSGTLSMSDSRTVSQSKSLSISSTAYRTRSNSKSGTQTYTDTKSVSNEHSKTMSPSFETSATNTQSRSMSRGTESNPRTVSYSPSGRTKSHRITNSRSGASMTRSPSFEHTGTRSRSNEKSKSLTATVTTTDSLSDTRPRTKTPPSTHSKSPSVQRSRSNTQSPSFTDSVSSTVGRTLTSSPSNERSRSLSQTRSNTPDQSGSFTQTQTRTQSLTYTRLTGSQQKSASRSRTPTFSRIQSLSKSNEKSKSVSSSMSNSFSPSLPRSRSASPSRTLTVTFTMPRSMTFSTTVSRSGSADRSKSFASVTVSGSSKRTRSMTISVSVTHMTRSLTHRTHSKSSERTRTVTKTASNEGTSTVSRRKTKHSRSMTQSNSLKATPSKLPSKTRQKHGVSHSMSLSGTNLRSRSNTQSLSFTFPRSMTRSESGKRSQTFTPSVSDSKGTFTRKTHTSSRPRSMSWSVSPSWSNSLATPSKSTTFPRSKSISSSHSKSRSEERTTSFSLSPSDSPSQSKSRTIPSQSHTYSQDRSKSKSPSRSLSLSNTVPGHSKTISISVTDTVTGSGKPTISQTFSFQDSMSQSDTPSKPSVTLSDSRTHIHSKSRSQEQSASKTMSLTRTTTQSRSLMSPSKSPSKEKSPSATRTIGRTASFSTTVTLSKSSSISSTLTVTSSSDITASKTRTPPNTKTKSQSKSFSQQKSSSKSPSYSRHSPSHSDSNVKSSSPSSSTERSKSLASPTHSGTFSDSGSRSDSPVRTVSIRTLSPTNRPSQSFSPSRTLTKQSRSQSSERTLTRTKSISLTATNIRTKSSSSTLSYTDTISTELSMTAFTNTRTLTADVTFSPTQSVSRPRSRTHPPTATASKDQTPTFTRSPPPTHTRSPTDEKSNSQSHTTTYDHTASFSRTRTSTAKNTLSATERSSSHSRTPTSQRTRSFTSSDSQTRSNEQSASKSRSELSYTMTSVTVSVSHNPTRTGSFDRTISVSDTISSTFPSPTFHPSSTLTKRHTHSQSISATVLSTATLTTTLTKSISLPAVFPNAFWRIKPSSPTYTWTAGRQLFVSFVNVPLDPGMRDAAGILDVRLPCVDANNVSNPKMVNLTHTGKWRVQNWTWTPASSGIFRVCYYTSATAKWVSIASPANITIVPGIVYSTYAVDDARQGFSIAFRIVIYGANISGDVFTAVPWNRRCDETNAAVGTFSIVSYKNALVIANGTLSVTPAGYFGICYLGFPYSLNQAPVRINRSPLKTLPYVSSAVISAGGMAGSPAAFTMIGFGFSSLDRAFISNDTVNQCDTSVKAARTVIKAQVQNPGYPYQAQTLFIPQVTFTGNCYVCYKANVSKSYILLLTTFMQPIAPAYFTPNNTQWPAGSLVELSFFGSGIDSTYDTVSLMSNSGACVLGNKGGISMTPYQPNKVNINVYRALITVASTYTICYYANTSLNPVNVGTTQVIPHFYQDDPVFANGANVRDVVMLTLQGEGVYVNSTMSLSLWNSTMPNASCTGFKGAQPSATFPQNNSIVLNLTSSGNFVLCLRTPQLATIMSEVIGVRPDPPTTFVPALIAAGDFVSVVFSGGSGFDLTHGDRIFPCDFATPSFYPVISPSTALVNFSTIGLQGLCFRSGVSATVTNRIDTSMSVSPIVNSVTLVPTLGQVGTSFSVSVTGIGIAWTDVMYDCNATSNTSTLVFKRTDLAVWSVATSASGTFYLCYQYGTIPSLSPGVIRGNPVIQVDPIVRSMSPTLVMASQATPVTIVGLDVSQLTRVYVNTNNSGCNLNNPYVVSFSLVLVNNSQLVVYSASIGVRGLFTVCYIGPSGTSYSAPDSIGVQARVSGFVASQSGATVVANTTTQFYSNFPVTVVVSGGGLDYSLDTFFAVAGSICTVGTQTRLTTSTPPIGATDSLTLTFLPPQEGSYSICYQLGSLQATLIPNNFIVVVNGLSYSNSTLSLQGPYSGAGTSVIQFQFNVVGRSSALWTTLATASTAVSLSLPTIPYGDVAFRALVYDRNGLLLYTLTTAYSSQGASTFCGTVPSTFTDSDATRKFAKSIILLYNFDALSCYSLVDTAASATLARSVSQSINNDASLVTDPVLVLGTLARILMNQRDTTQRISDAGTVLTLTGSTLQVPTSSVTTDLLNAQTSLVNTLAASLISLLSDPSMTAAQGQSIALSIISRLQLIASRYCDTSSAASLYNQTLSAVAIGALSRPVTSTSKPVVNTGYGVTVSPSFSGTSSSGVCTMGSLFTGNVLPQRASSASRRQLLQTTSTPSPPSSILPTLPTFNLPVLVYSLPKTTATTFPQSSPSATFTVPYTTPTTASDQQVTGWTLSTALYRFVPDGGSSGTGEWVLDSRSSAVLDTTTQTIVITSNSSTSSTNTENNPITASNFFVVSGRYLLTPTVFIPPDSSTDLAVTLLTCFLVVAHILLCLCGYLVDRSRDASHEPDYNRLLQPENHISLHRYLTVGTRKPHHPTSTWLRCTAAFTFLFAALFFAVLAADSAPFSLLPQYNILVGFLVTLLATPFAAITRTLLRSHLWDYASNAAATCAMAAVIITVPLFGVYIASAICSSVGIVVFFIAIAVMRTRWGFELQPNPGPFHRAFGLFVHVVVEGVSVGFVLYLSTWRGTANSTQGQFAVGQIMGWALLFDACVFEPIKNLVMINMRNFVVAMEGGKEDLGNTPAVSYAAGKNIAPVSPTESGFDELDETAATSFADLDIFDDTQSARSVGGGTSDLPVRAFARRNSSVGGLSEVDETAGSDFGDDESSVMVDVATPRSSLGALSEMGDEHFEDVETAGTPTESMYGSEIDDAESLGDAGPTARAFHNERLNRPRSADTISSVSTSRAYNPVEDVR